MMELKEYQAQALGAFGRWLAELEKARRASNAAEEAWPEAAGEMPPEVRDYPRKAWERLAASGEVAANAGAHVSRSDAAGRPIPHICFKVPTGGGKTLLAAAALERMDRPTGLVLWIVPTKAIYQQTKDALWNREHPYRQMLERASGGRVKMLEKETRFTAWDVENYLCVLLLMLPAANRQKGKEFLRMFRDSGRYPSFFPDTDDILFDQRLLNRHQDLDRWSAHERADGPVKQSLFNVFKMLRPVVVLDEAHKAYGASDKANVDFVKSVNRLDPRMVIELSATPHRRISNLLVDISGVDLKAEEMVKLPVQVASFSNVEWRHTLAEAAEELDRLDAEAKSLYANEGRYVRPIAIVRVERTGKDQRDGEHIHAEDVRSYLTTNLGVPADAVRVKSSEHDELGREDLLSELSPVRWIITKAALMEGWDCPFAYLLAMLDNTQSQRALTQLVGRVMRMPHAHRTGREALDQCYVYCWNTDVGTVVQQVKAGLENEGLTGLEDDVRGNGPDAVKLVTVQRREPFRGREIFLPKVLHRDGDRWVDLDYESHILSEISWSLISTPGAWQESQPDEAKRESVSVDVDDTPPLYHEAREVYVDKTASIAWFARRLADIVPNPWQAARIAQAFICRLRDDGKTDEAIYDRRTRYASSLRDHVMKEADVQAEMAFRGKLQSGAICFDLEAGEANYRLRETYEIQASQKDWPLQVRMSLFEPEYDRFDSELERNFARYLDEQKALSWWHRVAARQRGEYFLRGWRRNRIFPDFIAFADKRYAKRQLFVLETKGEHLEQLMKSDDTQYKRKVFELLQNAFNGLYRGGEFVIREGEAKGVFQLVFSEAEFPVALAKLEP